MTPFIRIMHIDQDYQIFLMVIEEGGSKVSNLSITEALILIKTQKLDLILSEPQNMAIFDKAKAARFADQRSLLLRWIHPNRFANP